jgi:hypothetical protein
MINTFRFLTFNFFNLSISCTIYGHKKDDYTKRIGSLMKTMSPRSFNGRSVFDISFEHFCQHTVNES